VIDFAKTATDLFQLGCKVADLYTRRVLGAQHAFTSRASKAAAEALTPTPAAEPESPWQAR
jgi:hypothetical protein